jgi:gluconolactonase
VNGVNLTAMIGLFPKRFPLFVTSFAFSLTFAFGQPQPAALVQEAIPGVVARGTPLTLVKDGFQGNTEGPMEAPDGGFYFSDIEGNRTYKVDRVGAVSVWREHTNRTNGLYLRNGKLLCAESNGPRIIRISADGSVTPLATAYQGNKLRAPNDLIPDKKGGIYFTDPAPRPAPGVPPKEPGNVHYLRPDGKVLLVDDQIARPNGLTLSLDGRTLFVDDTEGEYLWAFDVQPDGSTANKRQFVKFRFPQDSPRGPRSGADGMAIDSKGRFYVATNAGVQVLEPNGEYLGIIRLPRIPTNVAFGGPDRRTLMITAQQGVYKIHTLSQGPKGRAK